MSETVPEISQTENWVTVGIGLLICALLFFDWRHRIEQPSEENSNHTVQTSLPPCQDEDDNKSTQSTVNGQKPSCTPHLPTLNR